MGKMATSTVEEEATILAVEVTISIVVMVSCERGQKVVTTRWQKGGQGVIRGVNGHGNAHICLVFITDGDQ